MIKKITAIILALTMMVGMGTTVLAEGFGGKEAIGYIHLSSQEQLRIINENSKLFEDYLEKKGTTVIETLCNEKERLENLLAKEEKQEQIARLSNLISSYANKISQYEDYKRNIDDGIVAYGNWHPVYSVAITAIGAFFLDMQYYLAAELLFHAEDAVSGEKYRPANGNIAYDTVEYQSRINAIVPGTSGSGSSIFNKGRTTADDDLYYAIKKYNYTYNRSNEMFLITDTYNYEGTSHYEGLAGTAVNTMYLAQLYGTITPYIVQIDLYY